MNCAGSLTRIALLIGYLPWLGAALRTYSPPYLRELCCSTTLVQRRCCLRSDMQAELIVPRSRIATRQRRTFSFAGLDWASCHSLPNTCSSLHLLPLCPQDR